MKPYNICIIRPPNYVWSSVFKEMAELMAYAIHDLGYPVRIAENKLVSTGINIVIGAHLMNTSMATDLPDNTIIFNTEQLGMGSSRWNEKIIYFTRRFESWDYSTRNIEEFRKLNIPAPRLFKFGYHARLQRISKDVEKDIDVLFYGGLTPARQKILDALENQGLRVVRLVGVFGDKRDAYIARSKLILNLHQHAAKILEIIRIHYLMNNGKAILSQFDADSCADIDYLDGLALARYEEVVNMAREIIGSPNLLAEYEEKSLRSIRKFDATAIMRELLTIPPQPPNTTSA